MYELFKSFLLKILAEINSEIVKIINKRKNIKYGINMILMNFLIFLFFPKMINKKKIETNPKNMVNKQLSAIILILKILISKIGFNKTNKKKNVIYSFRNLFIAYLYFVHIYEICQIVIPKAK